MLRFVQQVEESKSFQFVLDLRQTKDFESYLPRLKAMHIGEKLGFFRLDSCFFTKDIENSFEGKRIELRDLSSGEATLIMKTISISSVVQDDSLILLDEPENSLHPTWQIKLLDSLKTSLRKCKGCHIIIATHSPYLISNVSTDNSAVIHLSRNNKEISGYTYDADTFGWSIEKILIDIFGVATSRNFYFEQKVRKLAELISKEEKSKDKLMPLINDLREFNITEDDPLRILLNKAEELIN